MTDSHYTHHYYYTNQNIWKSNQHKNSEASQEVNLVSEVQIKILCSFQFTRKKYPVRLQQTICSGSMKKHGVGNWYSRYVLSELSPFGRT